MTTPLDRLTCPACNGTGNDAGVVLGWCITCHGKGHITAEDIQRLVDERRLLLDIVQAAQALSDARYGDDAEQACDDLRQALARLDQPHQDTT